MNAAGTRTRSRRPAVMIAGIVLSLGAVGGVSGAVLGGLGAAAAEHSGEHPGRHGEHRGDDPDDGPLPVVVPAPAAPGR